MPYLAANYLLKNYSFTIFNNLVEFYMGMMANDTSEKQVRDCLIFNYSISM